MSIPLGIQAELSYLSTGTRSTWGALVNGINTGSAPSLTAFNSARDVTLNLTSGEADVTTRGGGGWKLTAQALWDCSIEIESPWNPSDAGFSKFLGCHLTRTPIACAVLDGPHGTSGSQGVWADFAVMEFTREENEDKEQVAKIKLVPTLSAVAPEWVQAS